MLPRRLAQLYGGLVLSQATQPFTSPVPIQIVNAPADVIVLSDTGAELLRSDVVRKAYLGEK